MIVRQELDTTYRSAVTLEEYARLISYSECAIYGVYNQEQYEEDACRSIWTLEQRNYILRYFAEAQEEIENEIGKLLSPAWITGNLQDTGNQRFTDIQSCTSGAYYPKWANVITYGTKVKIPISLSVPVDHTNDPATIVVPFNSVIIDFNFLKVYYPNTEIEINPSNIFGIGTDLYIQIPRCRMVQYDLRDNPVQGLLYTELTNFQTEVDVVYLTTDCTSKAITNCNNGQVGLNYLAGEIINSVQQKDMVIRLAHSKSPETPCGCPLGQSLWTRDRNIPDILTAERLNNPFGINDGAHMVYRFCQSMKARRIGYV